MDDIKKKQMNDVIVPQNDIVRRPTIVPEERPSITPKTESQDRFEKNPFFEKLQHKQADTRKPKSNGSKGILWSLVFVLFLAGGFAVASYFATAVVEIIPITRTSTLDSDFTALSESTEGDGSLVFQFSSTTEEASKEVDATVEKKIQIKASGTVVIYNAYSSATQRLVPNTRFETSDHKIFRISKPVVVPGTKIVNGKTVPGSIEAVVYADVAGEEYNIELVDRFTVPGFKGDPRFDKFYAVSKPDSPISGGFNNTVKVPSDEAIALAREELKQEMKTSVVEKARADIPENMTFFPGSMVIKFEEVPQDYSEENATKVSVRAVVSVFFFDTELLTQKLVDGAFPDDKGREVSVDNMSSFLFTFLEPVEGVVLSDISKLKFHLSGSPVFVGNIDINKIRTELAGKSKKEFTAMIASQTNIHKADATFRPAWNTVFPTDPAKISVKILTK